MCSVQSSPLSKLTDLKVDLSLLNEYIVFKNDANLYPLSVNLTKPWKSTESFLRLNQLESAMLQGLLAKNRLARPFPVVMIVDWEAGGADATGKSVHLCFRCLNCNRVLFSARPVYGWTKYLHKDAGGRFEASLVLGKIRISVEIVGADNQFHVDSSFEIPQNLLDTRPKRLVRIHLCP